MDISKGFVDKPVPAGIDIVKEIKRLCKEKNQQASHNSHKGKDNMCRPSYSADIFLHSECVALCGHCRYSCR